MATERTEEILLWQSIAGSIQCFSAIDCQTRGFVSTLVSLADYPPEKLLLMAPSQHEMRWHLSCFGYAEKGCAVTS